MGISNSAHLDQVRQLVRLHTEIVTTRFAKLPTEQLSWNPDPRNWNVLQCIEHMAVTHDFYWKRMKRALPTARRATNGTYAPSLNCRIYKSVAFNPRVTIPAPPSIVPQRRPGREALPFFLDQQARLWQLTHDLEEIDLSRLCVHMYPGIFFNLGDCVINMARHDALHMDQIERVLKAYASGRAATAA